MKNIKQDEILEELRRITKLVALIAMKDLAQNEKIVVLSNLRMQPKEISELLGITANLVRVTLHNIRKKSKTGKKSQKKTSKEDFVNDEQATT